MTKVMAKTSKKINVHRRNAIRLLIMAMSVLIAIGFYLLINSHPEKPKLFSYILGLRLPALICMIIACISIGVATLIFQSIVNNRIVTPALLGMNAIYSFLHTLRYLFWEQAVSCFSMPTLPLQWIWLRWELWRL